MAEIAESSKQSFEAVRSQAELGNEINERSEAMYDRDRRSIRRGTLLLGSFLFVVLALGTVAESFGQSRNPIKIKNVRVGLPPGPFAKDKDENNQPLYLFKAASWAPVWVDLEVTAPIDQAIEIVVETPDGDDVISSARIVVPPPQPGNVAGHQLGRIPYLKPGGIFTEVTVNVRGANGKQLAETFQRRVIGMPPSRYLILSVGSSLPGLRLSKAEGQSPEDAKENDRLRNGWVELAQITNVGELPDQWFGYKGVDLLILTTGADPGFWNALANDGKRRAALREWVRRGGRVLVGVGGNADLINAIPEIKEMLPARLPADGKRSVGEIAMVLPNSPRLILKPLARGTIALQSLGSIADRPYQIKLLADERENAPPLVVQASHGLGRVTLVAFDLDLPPLVDWPHRDAFWEWLINISGTRLPKGGDSPTNDTRDDQDDDKYLTRMQNNLEFFEGVPVISFGWVALFILFYILLIGPVEYFVLKRLLKRLELTWITFPIIVITVSAASYFTAYELKGRDLKVNKVDLVEIDLRSNRVYGETWFTVFSPRIQNYTIGVEPIGPGSDASKPSWVADGPSETLPDTLLSWHGRAKSNRQSLFRRTYAYHTTVDADASGRQPFADGLEQVPIQVWSTKTFTANWAARMNPNLPLIVSTLRISEADPTQITGSITSNLPIETLDNAQILYRDRITPLPPLVRGTPRFISTNSQAVSATSWLQSDMTHKDLVPTSHSAKKYRGENDDDPTFRFWPVLFHDLVQGQFGRLYNASMREMDQSWRVSEKNPNEAILIFRLGRVEDKAEEMSNAPNTPTRLWLSELPGSGPRTPLKGTLRQETYIRVYIPILPAQK